MIEIQKYDSENDGYTVSIRSENETQATFLMHFTKYNSHENRRCVFNGIMSLDNFTKMVDFYKIERKSLGTDNKLLKFLLECNSINQEEYLQLLVILAECKCI